MANKGGRHKNIDKFGLIDLSSIRHMNRNAAGYKQQSQGMNAKGRIINSGCGIITMATMLSETGAETSFTLIKPMKFGGKA